MATGRLATEGALPTNRIPNELVVNRGSRAPAKLYCQNQGVVRLVIVAVGVSAMPVPGCLDDPLDVRIFRLPVEQLAGERRIGD